MESLRMALASKIANALGEVMDRCDGAHTLDGEGFSKSDWPDADQLLWLDPNAWDQEDIKAGKQLVRKYRRQLQEYGVDVDEILQEGTAWKVFSASSVPSAPRSSAPPSSGRTTARSATSASTRAAASSISIPASSLPPPTSFDLPEKFDVWRHGQDQAVLRALDSPKRFVVLAMPTGSGKSLAYMAAAKLSGARTVFLTSTKALQSQLVDDFSVSGLVDIRGANNYNCVASLPDEGEVDQTVSCDHGYCKAGHKCHYMSGGCLYYDQVAKAGSSSLLVTNYSYWMTKNEQEKQAALEGRPIRYSIGQFKMLVLDEAHDAVEELGSYCGVEIKRHDTESILGEDILRAGATEDQWKMWAHRLREKTIPRIRARMASTEELQHNAATSWRGDWRTEMKELRRLQNLDRSLAKVENMQGHWICDVVTSSGHHRAKFDPVWPAPYGESCLFLNIPKIILTSATIRPKTMELLGVKAEDVDFVDFPSVFKKERRPVIHVDTVRVDKNIASGDRKLWVAKIDAIIRARSDRKGIIHTVSYDRARYIYDNSKFRDYMLIHETRTAREVVEVFKRGDAPLVLLSPSMTTGWDFPYDACRYQVIAKIPFPDTRNKMMAARTADDPSYAHYTTMQTLVQACGRGMRAEDDMCETLIVDDHARWFIPKWRIFAPKWFMEAYRSVTMLPQPIGIDK